MSSEQHASMATGWGSRAEVFVGVPVELTVAGGVPADGIRVSRTYADPVPAGMTSTLTYWDVVLGGWHAVPSSLSADRRSVSAVVHHLSAWTDFTGSIGDGVSAVGDFLGDAADWAYYQVGKVFDTRVDAPSCSDTPSWVESTSFIETQRNNSILFCTGSDPKHPNLLVVKARINRGFAFDATLAPARSWTYNSTGSTERPWEQAVHVLGHLDDALSRILEAFAPNGTVAVGAGKELDFGISEDQVRSAGSSPTVLNFSPPSTTGFLISVLGQLVGTEISNLQDGYIAAAIAVAGCYDDISHADDLGSWTRALGTCVAGLDDAAAKQLSLYLLKKGGRSPAEAGQLAGKIIGRLTIYLALVGPAFSAMNFAAEHTLPASARSVTVFPRTLGVTTTTLRTAEVPADCQMPAQRLVGGRTTKGSPGEGSLNTNTGRIAYADFAGLGYKQALTQYECTAGGVGWPEVLVLVGAGGKLLGSYDLAKHDRQEHSTVKTVHTGADYADVDWDSYEGAGFYFVHHHARVAYAGGRLVLENDVSDYTPEAVADEITLAQYEKRRDRLKDPNVITDAMWETLSIDYSDYSFLMDNGTPCQTSGSTAYCSIEYFNDSGDDGNAVLTLVRSSSSAYGWRALSLDL